MSDMIELPPPLDELANVDLRARRSVRTFAEDQINLVCLGAVLFAAQGVSQNTGKRTIPSAGSSYPLRIRIAVRNVDCLKQGLYLYEQGEHALSLIRESTTLLSEVADTAFDASWLAAAPVALLISAEFERTMVPYAHQPPEGRAERYVWLEAGHAAQNVALAAESRNLATVFVGGFDDDLMGKVFRLPSVERPIGVFPLGYPASTPQSHGRLSIGHSAVKQYEEV